jgi:2-hydroxycyclohexanecarboxyl-CoA dehydrogenase
LDLQLGGNLTVVVGSARGLGRAIADGFAAEGSNLALIDRAPEIVAVAAEICRDRGVRAEGFVADVTDAVAVVEVASKIRAAFGRCDHVVFAAAVGSGKFGFPFWNLDPADWEGVLRVNLGGAVNVLHAFGPALAEARAGSILLIASVAGQIGSQTDPPYSASKAALINFAQCAAKDLAPTGVRVNTLCPGMIRTALNRSVYEAWAARQPESERGDYESWSAEKIARLVPLGRWQEPEDIAAMAAFLASTRARNITGQTINVDGGYVMHW